MGSLEQAKTTDNKIYTGHLVRNYFTVAEFPFTDKGFTLAMFRTTRILRDHGLNPQMGFRGAIPVDEGRLDTDIYSQSLAAEFAYWSGNGFLWFLGRSSKEGNLWLMETDTREGFEDDLPYTNQDFAPSTVALLRNTLAVEAARVHQDSLASHSLMSRYIQLSRELKKVGDQILG